ncbi:CsbD family protein [Phormidium sp. CCY1219]|jgi:uncharacterized protein YjbJ (UPF0337 family)|uniref:CsbD family protein n=1 Tax=Phormidium sp. CCY1219 TaxID=2886104 RepID=UPI002D1F8D52|nr:CsbD family protein [Phormidium sp. CCY1219]MEB3829818.1 CsbD family protein [Phormidium sp. CCY1219]
MSVENKFRATAKNLEGKAEEMMAEVTGDPEQKIEGKAKQAEAATEHAAENLKEEMEDKKEKIKEKEYKEV